jgi:hypothetical protein
MTEPCAPVSVITTELVAKTIAAISQIGEAARALERAGYTAKITGNKIAIEEGYEAHLIMSNGSGWWNVFASDGTPPVFTVGAFSENTSSWLGAE